MNLVDVVVELARAGGEILKQSVLQLDKIRIVSESRDDVTRQIDLEVEETIIRRARELGLRCVVIGEEHGVVGLCDNPEYVLIVDPLDGSANFVSNVPFYSISVAICRYRGDNTLLSDVVAGVVYYVPTDTMYIADVESKQFRIQGRDLVFDVVPHEKPTFIMYLEPRARDVMLKFLDQFWHEFPDVRVRIFGAASIELVETLLNKFTAFIDIRGKLRVVDIAAAYAIAKVLNAYMTDMRGQDLGQYKVLELPRMSVIASRSREVHAKIIEILSRVG